MDVGIDDAEIRAHGVHSVGRAPARRVERRGGGEAALFGGHKADHGGAFLDLAQAAHGDFGAHIVDLALGQLLQDRAFEGGGGQAVGDDALAGQFLAQRLGEADHPRL